MFAIEKNALAFETLRYNLVDGKHYTFNWPTWLDKKAMTCEELLTQYGAELDAMRGTIDLIVGGPPCQGFSTAGRRDPADPRNQMTEQYIALVEKLQPRYLVIENVAGYNMRFETEEGFDKLVKDPKHSTYADYVAEILGSHYILSRGLVNCADFGVPQNRFRYLVLCERKDNNSATGADLLEQLADLREQFLRSKKLPLDRRITVKEAIDDLTVAHMELVDNTDSGVSGFKETIYVAPVNPTGYLKLMRSNANNIIPNSRRLAKHKKDTVQYFKEVQETCRPGRCLSTLERKKFGKKKHSTTVLHPDRPAPTVTTLPDDILHYNEPRILTVRENARLQSFPDWFEFQGKYTTGGKQRKLDCPRYTQVGNAVPPLLANAIGSMLQARQLSLFSTGGNEVHIDSSAIRHCKYVEEIYNRVLSKLSADPNNPSSYNSISLKKRVAE